MEGNNYNSKRKNGIYNGQNKNQKYNNRNLKKKKDGKEKNIDDIKEEILKELSSKINKQVEISVNKKMKEEEKRFLRSKNAKIIRRDIFIILLIIIIGYLCYCLYNLDYHNIKTIINNGKAVEASNIVNEVKNEEASKNYIDKYRYLIENMQIDGENELYLYKEKITEENLSNSIKMRIAYKNLKEDKKISKDNTISFKAKDLLSEYKNIFGSNTTFDNETFTYDNNRFIYYNDMYLGFIENTKSNKNIKYKIEKAYEEENTLSFEVIVASTEGNKLKNISTDEIILEQYNNEDISTYRDKLSKYKFIFEENYSKYYFSSVEKIF